MEEKSEKILKDQRKALSHFLSVLSNSTSADNVSNAFKLFLLYDGKVQKFMNQVIEHQKLAKEIQDLNQELSVVNKDIKQYVNGLNTIDLNLTNLMTESSIYRKNMMEEDRETIQKQMFTVDDLLKASYNLRHGTAIKAINLLKNESIKEQIPIQYPLPQAQTINKSILHCPIHKLKHEFLSKIKDSKDSDKHQEIESQDSEDEEDDDMDDMDDGLDGLF